ncbi:MAG: hypothetical protein CMJ75_07155 [Planctomycetaceae bacterium]|nr:hypothetical protein [Planctomycetaceae bacterium]
MTVFLLATLDTKGPETQFLREHLRAHGCQVCLVDVGCLGKPTLTADISREEVFAAAGTTHQELLVTNDRGVAVAAAARGAAQIITNAQHRDPVQGVLALGGSAGTTIGTAAMRVLPVGTPKLMVSTLASGQVRPYVADKDILMLNSVVDLAGINRISRRVLANAAAAMAGMVQQQPANMTGDRPLVAATMFGVTTPCVERARTVLEDAGYEVLVFHATGNGGQAMESLIEEGVILGVLDLTTTELVDELVGGILSAGPARLTAAARRGIPQVISVGATDMVNFGPPDTIPTEYSERTFYHHNPTVTLMRTTVSENQRVGAEIARKVADAKGPAVILLPLRGVSSIDAEGQPFKDLLARQALFDAIKENTAGVPVVEMDQHINDELFAVTAAEHLLAMLQAEQLDKAD